MKTIRRLAPLLITLLASMTIACSDTNGVIDSLAPASPITDPTPADPAIDPTASRVDTVLSMSESLAGESVQVQCVFYNRNGDIVEGTETILIVSRDVPAQAIDLGFELTPTQTGGYDIKCSDIQGTLVDRSPASLRVLPNLPFTWAVDLQNENCFHLDLHLPITVMVTDEFGNEITNAHASIVVIPETGVEGDVESGLRFTEEGSFDISITLDGELAPGAIIEPVVSNVHVDETGPVVSINAPARGEMIQMGTEATMDISVLGSATDVMSSIVRLTVDGVEQDIPGDTSTVAIDASHASRWGLSVVSGTAEDSCGNIGHISHGFLRSETYYDSSLEKDPGATVVNGAIAQLNQSFLNDNDRGDIDDLATLVETIVAAIDLNETIPAGRVLKEDPYAEDCNGGNADTSYSISRHPDASLEVNMDGPWITKLQAVDGGLDFELSLANVAFPLQVNATASTCVLTDITWIDVTLGAVVGLDNLKVKGTFGIDYYQGNAQVNLDSFDAEFEGTYVDLDCGILDFACDLVTGAARGLIESIIEGVVEDKVRNDVPPLLQETLQGFALEKEIVLPAPLNTTLNAVVQPETITLCGPDSGFNRPASCDPSQNEGSVVVGLTTQFFPETMSDAIPSDARGSISRPAVTPSFNDSDYSFGIALRDDLINQLFWSMWYGGGLNIDIAESFADKLPAGVEAASLSATLPPVVMPGTDGNVIDIGMGDLKVEARIDMATLMAGDEIAPENITPYFVDIEFYVSMIMGGAIDIDPTTNELILIVDPSPEFYFHVVNINNGAYSQEAGAVLQGLLPEVLPELLSQALSSYSLPQINLSGVAGLPEGTIWELRNAELNNTDGYIQITGAVSNAQ